MSYAAMARPVAPVLGRDLPHHPLAVTQPRSHHGGAWGRAQPISRTRVAVGSLCCAESQFRRGQAPALLSTDAACSAEADGWSRTVHAPPRLVTRGGAAEAAPPVRSL